MEISDIASIELDRTRPFKHKILIKDSTGYVLQEISVTETAGWEKLATVYKAWVEHPDFAGKGKEIE